MPPTHGDTRGLIHYGDMGNTRIHRRVYVAKGKHTEQWTPIPSRVITTLETHPSNPRRRVKETHMHFPF